MSQRIRRAVAASFIGFAVAGLAVWSANVQTGTTQQTSAAQSPGSISTNYDSNERKIADKWG